MSVLKPYWDFVNLIGMRESSNDYACRNQFGYLGRYQFGLARLTDLGLCKRSHGVSGFANSAFEWIPPFSEEVFLGSKTLQDKCFEVHVAEHRFYLTRNYSKYLETEIQGVLVTLSGAIACAHLLGRGGFLAFVHGIDKADAFGTKASDYVYAFAGYEIPESLDRVKDIRDWTKYI